MRWLSELQLVVTQPSALVPGVSVSRLKKDMSSFQCSIGDDSALPKFERDIETMNISPTITSPGLTSIGGYLFVFVLLFFNFALVSGRTSIKYLYFGNAER